LDRISSDLRKTNLSHITIDKDSPFAGTDLLSYYLPQIEQNTGNIDWDTPEINIYVDETSALRRTNLSEPISLNVKSIKFYSDNNEDGYDLYPNEILIILELEKKGADRRIYTVNSKSIINLRNE
jgi:hypothetical protein